MAPQNEGQVQRIEKTQYLAQTEVTQVTTLQRRHGLAREARGGRQLRLGQAAAATGLRDLGTEFTKLQGLLPQTGEA